MGLIVLVNDEPITDDMVKKVIKRLIAEMQDEDMEFEPTKENMKYFKIEALNYLISRQLLLREAIKEGIDIDNKTLLRHFEEVKSTFDSKEEWERSLEELGLDEDGLIEEMRKDEIIAMYLEKRGIEDVKFTEDDLRRFYEENQENIKEPDRFTFYEIYFDNFESAKVIYEILEKLNVNSAITKELEERKLEYIFHSDVPEDNIPSALLEYMTDPDISSNTFLIPEEGGYFLYKVVGVSRGEKVPYENARDEIFNYLIEKAKKEKTSAIIEELYQNADIQFVDLSLL